MADKKISQLTSVTIPLDGTEVLPIVQGTATKKVTNNDLRPKQIQSNATSGVLQVTGPADTTTRVMTTPDANFTVARIDATNSFIADQTLATGNLVIGTSGKGIDFSATAGTGTSELLADYEEGTWTATVTPSSGSFTTITYGTNTYTKVGNIVTVTCRFTITDIGTGAGTMTISGLPYTTSLAYDQKPFSCRRVNDGVTLFGQVIGTTLAAISTVAGATGIVAGSIYTVCAFYTV